MQKRVVPNVYIVTGKFRLSALKGQNTSTQGNALCKKYTNEK
jgi:hypothetical protein